MLDTYQKALVYRATNKETGEVIDISEAPVRAEVVHMFQHDLGTFETDEDIVAGVTGSSLEDYFTDGVCEVANYQIKFAKYG